MPNIAKKYKNWQRTKCGKLNVNSMKYVHYFVGRLRVISASLIERMYSQRTDPNAYLKLTKKNE